MNKVFKLAIFLGAIGFIGIAVTGIAASGVDFMVSRTGLGMMVLGLGSLLVAFCNFFRSSQNSGSWLVPLSCLGGGYFIWRALSGGPIGLALPDVVLVLTFLAVYFVTMSSSIGGKRILIGALSLVCVVNVGIALMQGLSDESFFIWKSNVDSVKRVSGLFNHYNPFAAFLNGSIFFFLTFVLFGEKIFWRFASGILALGMLAAIVLSGSRGGWVSLMAGGSVWLIVVLTYLKQKKSKVFGVAMVLTIFFVVVGLTSSVWVIQKMSEKRAEKIGISLGEEAIAEVSDGGRLAYQQLAFEIFQDSPVIGMGPRAFSYLSLEKWDTENLRIWENPPVFAHNEYLQVLSDYGVIGLIIVIALGLMHGISGIYRSVSSTDSRNELSILQIGAIGGIGAILCQCFFSFLFHFPSCVAIAALLVGVLGSRSRQITDLAPKLCSVRLSSFFGFIVAISLIVVGGVLTQSFLLHRKAKKQLVAAIDEQSVFRALDTMAEAGKLGSDPRMYERLGRLAMNYAIEVGNGRDQELSKQFNLKAKSAFKNALKHNPHFPPGLAALPRVEDALGNWNEAEVAHKNAMEKLWCREMRLHPYFYAAESSYFGGLRAHYAGEQEEAFVRFREARERILRSREILGGHAGHEQEKAVRSGVEAWIAYMEARLLFREGDQVWKNARPRNPELAYALMLEAQKRYEASATVIRGKDSNWERQVKQLQVNLNFLKGGQFQPAKLSEEQIESIVSSEQGLDSPPVSR